MSNNMVEVWIVLQHTGNTYAYYDGDATLSDIVKDLKANQCEIRNIEYSQKGSMNTFIINVV